MDVQTRKPGSFASASWVRLPRGSLYPSDRPTWATSSERRCGRSSNTGRGTKNMLCLFYLLMTLVTLSDHPSDGGTPAQIPVIQTPPLESFARCPSLLFSPLAHPVILGPLGVSQEVTNEH